MNITTIGIDIAKRIFQLHGIDKNGRVVLKKKIIFSQIL
jgi:transposase